MTNTKISLQGTYKITGSNQDKEQSSYSGFLHLNIIGSNRVTAEWVIDSEQTQKGTGFFHEDTLVINFYYQGEEENKEKTYKGVVVYTTTNNNTLKGFWSEKHGNEDYLGFEEGKKLTQEECIFNRAKLN